jgi:hypothetical protein
MIASLAEERARSAGSTPRISTSDKGSLSDVQNPARELVRTMNRTIQEQKELCRKYGVQWVESPEQLKVGIARNVRMGIQPLNGMRHPAEGDTTGWYIWAGEELSAAPDFFEALHVSHLEEWCPAALKFLGLPPGWRFLIAGDHVDVWEDRQLLDV